MQLVRRTTLLAMSLCLVLACGGIESEDDDELSDDDVPSVPSEGTLSLDLSVDPNSQNLEEMFALHGAANGLAISSLTSFLGTNHGFAVLVVWATNSALALQLVVPVALLREAASATPQSTGDNVWVWSFSVTASARTWTGNLTGERVDGGTEWAMRITGSGQNGCCDDFLLFDGMTSDGGKTGTWQLYDWEKPSDVAKRFQVTYDYTSDEVKALSFAVNSDKPSSESFGNGSTVRYEATETTITLRVNNSKDGSSQDNIIAWNRQTKAGSFTNYQGVERCWGPWDSVAKDAPNLDCDESPGDEQGTSLGAKP